METEKELNVVSNFHFLPDYRSTIFILVGLGYYHPCYFFLPDPVTKINVIHIEVLPPIVLAHVKDQWCRVPQKMLTLEKTWSNGFSCLRKSEMFVDPTLAPHGSGQLHFGF